jgi:hypothetical protein
VTEWDAIAPRLNCKTGTLLRDLTANDICRRISTRVWEPACRRFLICFYLPSDGVKPRLIIVKRRPLIKPLKTFFRIISNRLDEVCL